MSVATTGPARAHPARDNRPEFVVAAGSAFVLAVVSPLGLSSGEVADQVAHAFGTRGASTASTALADLLARVCALLPVGEAGMRGQLLAGAAALTALALSVATVRELSFGPRDGWSHGLVATGLRSSPRSPSFHASLGSSLLPAWAGMALLGFCRPFLETATGHPVTAIDLAMLVTTVLTLACVRRAPRRASAGLWLALLCGLGAGVGWPVRAATWPAAVIVSTWALRRGQRWPLLAPMVFVAGAGVALAAVVGAPPGVPVTMRALVHSIVIPVPADVHDGTQTRQILAWVIDDVGVLGLLVAAVGLCLMVPRAPLALLFLSSWAVAILASLWTGDILAARLFIATALVTPIAAAVTLLSASFGRARAAAAMVMIVIIVVPPAVVGVGAAMRMPVRRQPTLVARTLDAAVDARSRDGSAPADPEQARWWRYGRAIGLIFGPAERAEVVGRTPAVP